MPSRFIREVRTEENRSWEAAGTGVTVPTGWSRTCFGGPPPAGVVSRLTEADQPGDGSIHACTIATTDAPSPLALATRFIDPARMSPTAKIPGTVVCRVSGGRPPSHPAEGTSRP